MFLIHLVSLLDGREDSCVALSYDLVDSRTGRRYTSQSLNTCGTCCLALELVLWMRLSSPARLEPHCPGEVTCGSSAGPEVSGSETLLPSRLLFPGEF